MKRLRHNVSAVGSLDILHQEMKKGFYLFYQFVWHLDELAVTLKLPEPFDSSNIDLNEFCNVTCGLDVKISDFCEWAGNIDRSTYKSRK